MRLFGRKEKIEKTEKEGRREKKTRRTRNPEKESITEQESLTRAIAPEEAGKTEQSSREEAAPAADEERTTEQIAPEMEFPEGLQVSAASLIGSRKNQQDSLAFRGYGPYGLLASVCDGMGGLSGGEQASQTACDGLFHCFEKAMKMQQMPEPADFFLHTAEILDGSVAGLRGNDGRPLGAGTTITAVLIRDGILYWLAVGDSKIYLIREGQIQCLTTPHNYQMLLRKRLQTGLITQEEYEQEFPRREALISYLGMGGLAYVDTPLKGIELLDGDLILLCSDGFYREYPEAALIQRLQTMDEDDFTEWASILAGEVAVRRPPHMDNTSLILIRYNKKLHHVDQNMTNPEIIDSEIGNNETIHNEIIHEKQGEKNYEINNLHQ